MPPKKKDGPIKGMLKTLFPASKSKDNSQEKRNSESSPRKDEKPKETADSKTAPREDENSPKREDTETSSQAKEDGERQSSKDSKHYQVGGDTKFPRKYSKAGPGQLKAAGQDSSRRRVLQAASQTSRTVELYLPNLAKHPDDSFGDIGAMVRECGKRGRVHVITSRVVQNRYNENIVGCRITVPERHVDDALGNRVWPEGIKCRRWSSQKQTKNERKNQNHGKPKKSEKSYFTRTWNRSNGYWIDREEYDEDEEWREDGGEKYFYYDEDQGYEDCQYENWEDRFDSEGNDISQSAQ